MKKNVILLLLLSVLVSVAGCQDMDDTPVPSSLEVKDFVWRGMNLFYLWQADVPDLADSKRNDQKSYENFLSSFATPVDLFNHLRYDNTIDRFSRIFNDYSVLEGVLSGNTLNNGVDFQLYFKSGNSGPVFGVVRYILLNSDASTKDIHRGNIFYAINGIPLYDNGNNNNWYDLLNNNNTYTLNLADYDNGNITPNGKSVTLTKTNLAENPILINTVIQQEGHNIGYLMYNGFYPSYDNQLNQTFGHFLSQNVTDLVLDLRYNSGGSIASATKLASMITGQFTGQLFARQQWNAKAQNYYGNSVNNYIGGLNSLKLNRIFILTSKSTASASELVINCLKPYINVVQIGGVTTGKNVGSITLYDSPTFAKKNVNPHHKYAMQPIVLKIVNKDGFGDYALGITPNTEALEDISNLGTLGDVSEPLLNIAINQITGHGRKAPFLPSITEKPIIDSKSMTPLGSEMYLENE